MKRSLLAISAAILACIIVLPASAQNKTLEAETAPIEDRIIESRPEHQEKPNPRFLAWENFEPGTSVTFIEDDTEHAKGPRLGQWQTSIKLLMKGKEGLVLRITRFQGGVKMAPRVTNEFVANSFEGMDGADLAEDRKVRQYGYRLPDGKMVAIIQTTYTDRFNKSKYKWIRTDQVPGGLVKSVVTDPEGKTRVMTLSSYKIVKADDAQRDANKDLNAQIKELEQLKQDIQNEYAYFMTHARALTPHEQEQLSKVAAVTSNLDKAIIALQTLKKHVKDGDPLKPEVKPMPGIAPEPKLN